GGVVGGGPMTAERPSLAGAGEEERPLVLVSIPLGRMAPAAQRSAGVPAERRGLPAGLREALARGDSGAARAALDALGAEERSRALGELGEMLRSTLTAEAVLDGLPAGEQVRTAAAWAREPRLRPVAFARLAVLSGSPSVEGEVRAALADLSSSDELRGWVRSAERMARSGGRP
ncbi:MAG: hypothetical protein IBJ11_07145, partial [Phycisphaerales bacterium]|nr:hypothetical protein [Phycisphaerales bacterium]